MLLHTLDQPPESFYLTESIHLQLGPQENHLAIEEYAIAYEVCLLQAYKLARQDDYPRELLVVRFVRFGFQCYGFETGRGTLNERLHHGRERFAQRAIHEAAECLEVRQLVTSHVDYMTAKLTGSPRQLRVDGSALEDSKLLV